MKIDKKALQHLLRSELRAKQRMDSFDYEKNVVLPATEKLLELESHGIYIEIEGVQLTDVNEWLAQADAAIAQKREELRLQIIVADAEATAQQVTEAKETLRLLTAKARKTAAKARKA